MTSLSEYIADPERRAALSLETGAHQQWLWQVAVGWRGKRVSRALALAIERATSGEVSRHELRPDIWPEPAPSEDKRAA